MAARESWLRASDGSVGHQTEKQKVQTRTSYGKALLTVVSFADLLVAFHCQEGTQHVGFFPASSVR